MYRLKSIAADQAFDGLLQNMVLTTSKNVQIVSLRVVFPVYINSNFSSTK